MKRCLPTVHRVIKVVEETRAQEMIQKILSTTEIEGRLQEAEYSAPRKWCETSLFDFTAKWCSKGGAFRFNHGHLRFPRDRQ